MSVDQLTPSTSPEFPNLRQILDARYACLPAPAIREQMEAAFGPGSAEDYENYLEFSFGDVGNAFSSAARDVGHFAAKAAPAVATVGGGALQGALAGSQFGPLGIIAGAATGGVGAGLSKYGSGTARDIGNVLSGVTNVAGQFSPAGKIGATLGSSISGLAGGGRGGVTGAAVNALTGVLGGAAGSAGGTAGVLGGLLGGNAASALSGLFGGSSAIGQLLSLLQRPETMQALAALNLGPLGTNSIRVGANQTPLPVSGIARLVGTLAHEASDEAAMLSESAESDLLPYMIDASGEFVGDPSLARDRAARIWNLLNDAQAERLVRAICALLAEQGQFRETTADLDSEAVDEEYDDAEYADTAYYDALDLAELYTLPRYHAG